jgi:hypothetical protein
MTWTWYDIVLLIVTTQLFTFLLICQVNRSDSDTIGSWTKRDWNMYVTVSLLFPVGLAGITFWVIYKIWPKLIQERKLKGD